MVSWTLVWQRVKLQRQYPLVLKFLALASSRTWNPLCSGSWTFALTKSQVAKAVSTCPQILGYSIAKNLKAKMLVLNGFLGANRSAHLVAKWPQLLGYSYRRLTTRLQILAEQDKTDKLTTAMSLTEEAFQRRFPNGPKTSPRVQHAVVKVH